MVAQNFNAPINDSVQFQGTKTKGIETCKRIKYRKKVVHIDSAVKKKSGNVLFKRELQNL